MGEHTTDKALAGSQDFFKSATVENATRAAERERISKLKTADDFNREQEAKKVVKPEKEKKPVFNKEGRSMCANKGCRDKSFLEEENHDEACHHHAGEPVFHDLKKYWSCCSEKPAYDFDDFLKLPTC